MCSRCLFFFPLNMCRCLAPRAYLVPSESGKGALDPLELTSYMCHYINNWSQAPGTSGKAAITLNCQIISPVPSLVLFN